MRRSWYGSTESVQNIKNQNYDFDVEDSKYCMNSNTDSENGQIPFIIYSPCIETFVPESQLS